MNYDIRKEHRRLVDIEMPRLEKTGPVLFTDNSKKVTVRVNGNTHTGSTDSEGDQNQYEQLNDEFGDDDDASTERMDEEDSDEDFKIVQSKKKKNRTKEKIIDDSDEDEVLEPCSETENEDSTLEALEVVENLPTDQDSVNTNKTPTAGVREDSDLQKSVESDATNPTNNKDGTKGNTTTPAKKQLKMPKNKKISKELNMKKSTLTKEIKRNHKIIYSLKLHCPKIKDPMKSMQEKLREWFKEMTKCSPSFIVYKWKDESF